MIHKVEKTIRKYQMLQTHDRVIVAVSGGPDSVALLHIIIALAEKFRTAICMAYLNHGLRGEESVREESFVKQLGERLSVPVVCKSVDIIAVQKDRGRGMSIEEVGRQERYQFLYETASKFDAQKIALGHHLNDQCETVMINLIRGSGVEGLKGILPIRNGKIIRPLIDCTKDEILTYLENVGLPFVHDLSNAEDIYLRNRIRNHLIPEIKSIYNPSFENSLHHMADLMRIDNDFISTKTNKAMAEMRLDQSSHEYTIKIPDLLSYHEAIQNRVIKNVFLSFSTTKTGIAYVHITAFRNLILGDNLKASLNLPFGIKVQREGDIVSILYKPRYIENDNIDSQESNKFFFQYDHVPVPGKININELGIMINFSIFEGTVADAPNVKKSKSAYMDYDKIFFPLMVRSIKPGDRIIPLGMKGTQKLKSIFINEKVPANMRYKIPILADAMSIIWVAGIRLSEHVKITDKTRNIIKAEIV
jgi:tRNA(Ile)-lysidine synthase